jgi:uncharacterized protein (TIGR02453 family)
MKFKTVSHIVRKINPMLQHTSVQFLKDLSKNNNKEWFDKNRKQYEQAKSDFEGLTAEILKRLGETDETIAHLQPKDCLFRINRDVRFSKNKSPYKTNMGMSIARGGKKVHFPGYYFHFEPGASFAAGGLWMPMAPELKKLRQEIDYNWDEFKKIIQSEKFKTVFGDLEKSGETSLTRPPKGYDAAHPGIEYLKLKSFIASASVSDADIVSENLARKITATFEALRPLISFFNRALEK